ncbi:hypothetical protein [Clostridium sp. AWRP]|uniref:hypothetical protein n=1 Tax=Clostridium sp. AWRP TaxID=2212991 RepID=UPI000FDA3A34|nr:hypothetical protein [Clostridium sp. AWRP]AZV56397.1 hypothetical protein DMR38_07110 [Clostridium sp. AWRP]
MITIFIIECIVFCAVFTIFNLTYLFKKPLDWFYDYPDEVQARMRTLPQYKGKIPLKENNYRKKKIPAVIIFLIISSIIVWFSGARDFVMGTLYAFALFMVINFYDALILDTIYFCHSKKVRYPGTEDMVKAYENPKKHWIGFLKGTGFAVGISLLVGGIVEIGSHLVF